MSKQRPSKKKAGAKPAGKGPRAGAGPPQKTTRQPKNGPRVDPEDPVEEASWESFPASDPPSFNPAPRRRDS